MTEPDDAAGHQGRTRAGTPTPIFTEGSDISKYDSAKQQWIQQGDVIDVSGKSKNCAFDQATSTCK